MLANNINRAAWGKIAAQAFADTCGPPLDSYPDCCLADLICDVMHYARSIGLDPIAIAEHGIGEWSAEERNPDPYANDQATISIQSAIDMTYVKS